jgi:hypothetical protein
MLVLFDQSTPVPFRPFLQGHTVETAWQRRWETLRNGDLLQAAEEVTPDKNIRYQQNLKNYKIAIVVLENPQWPALRNHVDRVVAAVNAAKPALIVKLRFQSTEGRSVPSICGVVGHHCPALHHPLHFVDRHVDVRQRIAFHCHQIGEISRAYCS